MHDTARGTLIIVYFDLGIGGVQRKIIDIANHLYTFPRFRTMRIVILLDAPDKELLARSIINPNVAIHHKPAPWLPFWLYIAWYTLLTHDPRILSFLALPAVEVHKAMQFFFWKRVRVVDSEDVITSHAYRRGDFSAKINGQITAALSQSDAVIVPSRPIAQDLVRSYRIPITNIHIIPNWTILAGKPTESQRKTVDLLYIGRFDKEKQLTELISSLSFIQKVIPDVSLLLMGEGSCKSTLQSEIKTLNLTRAVTFAAPKSSVRKDILRAKIAVYMSESEGVPLFLLEAMALGIPVVTNNFPGARSVVTHGKSGYVFGSSEQFIHYTTSLLQNKRARLTMGTYARRQATTAYSASNINAYIFTLFPEIHYEDIT